MSTRALTSADFAATTAENEIVLIDWWATWCGPCRAFAPIYEAASEEHDDIVFAKVDTDAEQALAQQFGIRSIPTIMGIRDGILVFNQSGALPARDLEKAIATIRELDMSEVRAKAEAAAAARASSGT